VLFISGKGSGSVHAYIGARGFAAGINSL